MKTPKEQLRIRKMWRLLGTGIEKQLKAVKLKRKLTSNKMDQDLVRLMLGNPSAIYAKALIALQDRTDEETKKGLIHTLIVGTLLSENNSLRKVSDASELWECEVIIIPKKIYSDIKESWMAKDPGALLTTGRNPDNYKKENGIPRTS